MSLRCKNLFSCDFFEMISNSTNSMQVLFFHNDFVSLDILLTFYLREWTTLKLFDGICKVILGITGASK